MEPPHRHPRRRLRNAFGALVIAAFVASLSWGCRSPSKKSDAPEAEEPAPEPTSEGAAPSPMGLGMMSSLLSGKSRGPGPYDEPDSSPRFDKSQPHVAVIELDAPLVELRGFSWMGGFSGIELHGLIERLEALATDDAVTGLVLRFADLGPSPAIAEELRDAIVRIRASHPRFRVSCHAETASNFTYLVMTACDAIALPTGGQLAISGVAAVPMHLKGLLDKLGIKADFLHIGDYKGAAEPLTLERPSRQSQETTALILDQAFATLVGGIAAGRAMNDDAVRALVDQALFTSEAALAAKLIDTIESFETFRDQAAAGSTAETWRLVKLGDDDRKDPMTMLLRMAGMMPTPRPSGRRLAIVYAVGNVVDGGDGVGGARAEIGSRTLVAALRALAVEDDVLAIVLRVSSPGGSALASERIWSALEEVRKRKPVVVSMGAVAASGGYYISAGATRIFADANTLTGSIGVVGGKLATAGGLAKLGITTFPTGRGKHATVFASPEAWTADQRQLVRGSMQAVYDQFASRVRAGRGDIADALMQGRVWTGAKALEHKLIDEIGGLSAAVAYARKTVSLADDAPVEIYPPEPTLVDLLGGFGVSSGLGAWEQTVGQLDPALRDVLAQTRTTLRGFDKSAIQTVLIRPTLVH